MKKEFNDVKNGIRENIEDEDANKLELLKNIIGRVGFDSNYKIPKQLVTKLTTKEIEKTRQTLLDNTLNELVSTSTTKSREILSYL